eukprot:1267278-Prymnesium_polylepis.1
MYPEEPPFNSRAATLMAEVQQLARHGAQAEPRVLPPGPQSGRRPTARQAEQQRRRAILAGGNDELQWSGVGIQAGLITSLRLPDPLSRGQAQDLLKIEATPSLTDILRRGSSGESRLLRNEAAAPMGFGPPAQPPPFRSRDGRRSLDSLESLGSLSASRMLPRHAQGVCGGGLELVGQMPRDTSMPSSPSSGACTESTSTDSPRRSDIA